MIFLLNETHQRSIHTAAFTALALAALTLAGSGAGIAYAQTQVQTAAPTPPSGPRVWITPPPGNALRGLALYEKTCTACHSVDEHKIGPAHRGVVGRRVGSAPGYKYSDGMANSRLRWTPQSLNAWLTYPEDLVTGQRMNTEVENEQDRADLIAYLMTLK
ncbi:MAG: c-type cytochrome [Burkholderiaceae bacterium]